MLLSRVAEDLYWAARYLERAEDTARIVREHTNLLVDLPVTVPLTWEPLLAVPGGAETFAERHERADEASIITFLVADLANPSSVASAVASARDNLRATREVLPREAWQAVNELHLHVAGHRHEAVARRNRTRFLERVIAETQWLNGIVAGVMRHDEAFSMLRIGRLVERADMTTRVLDVRAAGLMAATERAGTEPLYEDVQWASVLRSLSALQMYHRTCRAGIDGPTTVRFLLTDALFPRSVTYCLHTVHGLLEALPRPEVTTPACAAAAALVASADASALDADGLHRLADDLQEAIAGLHDALAGAWFHWGEPPRRASDPR